MTIYLVFVSDDVYTLMITNHTLIILNQYLISNKILFKIEGGIVCIWKTLYCVNIRIRDIIFTHVCLNYETLCHY